MRSIPMETLEQRQLFSGGLPPIPLAVLGTAGADIINVRLDDAGKNVLWAVNGQKHATSLASVHSIVIQSFGGADQINVGPLTSGLSVSINAGAGSDNIYLGANGGKMSYLTSGNVTISGDSNPNSLPGSGIDKDSVFVSAFNENIANQSDRFDFYANKMHLGGLVPGVGNIVGIDVNFTGVEDFTFSGPLTKSAIYTVHSVSQGSTTRVFTGQPVGGDSIYVGDGDLDKNIAGNLDLHGYYGFNDWVYLSDNKALNGHVYNMKDNVLKTLQQRSITLPELSHVVLSATNWKDKLDVEGGYKFGSLKSFAVYGNNGGDELDFGSGALKLAALNNVPIYVDPGAGIDRILMQDGWNQKPAVYHLTQGKFSNDYGATMTFAPSTETFAVGGGYVGSTFDIVPGTATRYQLYGHLLSPNGGGETWLSLGLAGVGMTSFQSTGPNQGTYWFSYRMPVDIWDFSHVPDLKASAKSSAHGVTRSVSVAERLFSDAAIA